MSSPCFDVLYLIAELMEREGRCLRSLSSVSKEVRLACLPHLFRRLQYVSANRSTPCLEKYCKNLNSKDIKPYLRFVKIFSIMPLEEGSPRITRVSLCSLCAILKKLPNVETLDLVCFTWKGCRRAHDCLRGMSPLRLHRLEIVHVRVIGPDDPLNMLRIASSVDHFALLDVVPTTHTLNLNTTSLASVPRKSVSVQLLMDSRKLVLPDGVERKAPLYNNHPALSRALRLGLTSTLVDLRVAWGLSHYERAPSPLPSWELDLSRCTKLEILSLSFPARASAEFFLPHLAQTVTTLPSSTASLRVHVDVALRTGHDNAAAFEDKRQYWMQLWQAVALKKTIKAISIRCWDDELNVSRFPLSQRNEQWEVGLLKRARKVLRTAGYKGLLETCREAY